MHPQVEKIVNLPMKQKMAGLLVVIVALGATYYFLLQKPKDVELKTLQGKLDKIRAEIGETRKLANNLPKFRAEFEGLKKDLDSALTELPNSKEIPTLLTSITSAGKSVGLDFLAFRPKPEVPKEFYAEVPVDIVVSGPFLGIANFFVAVGNLPRIVNISNVSFSDIRNDRGRNVVKVTCQATTFRFMDKSEIKDPKDDKKKK
ncbi:MAG: type 4a pilus biogenesis protein PilO [Geobacteraceae bacterium]|nr:type 4a pilus biogenesis protein PilO [Geobacteraceae bacterium]